MFLIYKISLKSLQKCRFFNCLIRMHKRMSPHGDYDHMEQNTNDVLTTQKQLARIIDMAIRIKKY